MYVLYCAVLRCTVLYCAVLCCTVLCCTTVLLYCTVLYCTVLYCTVLYCTALYRTVLYVCTMYELTNWSESLEVHVCAESSKVTFSLQLYKDFSVLSNGLTVHCFLTCCKTLVRELLSFKLIPSARNTKHRIQTLSGEFFAGKIGINANTVKHYTKET